MVTLSTPATATYGLAPTAVTLSWTSVTGAASYAVHVSTDAQFGSTVFGESTTATTTGSAINGLVSGVTYYWSVNVTDQYGVKSGWTNASTFATAPAAVSGPVTPVNGATEQQPWTVVLGWSPVTGAVTYAVRVSTDAQFGSTVFDGEGLTAPTTGSTPIPGLASGVTYYWKVGAKDQYGVKSGWSGSWTFATVMPATLSAPTNGAQSVSIAPVFSWGAVTTAISYRLDISTGGSFSTTVFSEGNLTSGTSLQVAGLSNATGYFWRVGAKDAGGLSGWSSVWSFSTIAMPTLITPTPQGSVSIQPVLGWQPVSGATSYTVQVSSGADFSTTVFGVQGLATTADSVTGLVNGTSYRWRVEAANASGVSGWSGIGSFATIGTLTLSAPSTGAPNVSITPTLSWNALSGTDTYQVQVSSGADFSATVFSAQGVTGVSEQLPALANSQGYIWRVNAINASGIGGWSAAWSFTTIVAIAPAPLLALPQNGAVAVPVTLSLSWGAAPRAVSYALQVSTSSLFSTTVTAQSGITATLAGVSGFANNATYYWRVNATNVGGTGAWSAVSSFTTYLLFMQAIPAGWNMVSFNVRFADSCIDSVIKAPSSPNPFILVKDVNGHSYIPTLGIRNFDTLRQVVGYQVYTSANDTISAHAAPITVATTPIALQQGWNMIAYLPGVPLSVETELASIGADFEFVKNNNGRVYWPLFEVDDLDTMQPGQAYLLFMTQATSFTYPTGTLKMAASTGAKLKLPNPKHYAGVSNTGNNATVLAKAVTIGGKTAPDSSEIAAFNQQGKLVGAGTVIHGIAAFAVWGNDPLAAGKNGCADAETITFKLWDGSQEYPLSFAGTGGQARYAANGVFRGSLAVPEAFLIKKFDLARVYPNPFRGSLKIAFDVPALSGAAQHAVEINLYDMQGNLVHQIAKGSYQAGHYSLAWDGEGAGKLGAGLYFIQMKAQNFDKRIQLIRVR
jgi:hypothetical protein